MSFIIEAPWQSADEDSKGRKMAELKRELGPFHPLLSKNWVLVGERVDTDDVLLTDNDGGPEFAVVHLTWSGKVESNPLLPHTTFYSSLSECREKRLIPDQKEWRDR